MPERTAKKSIRHIADLLDCNLRNLTANRLLKSNALKPYETCLRRHRIKGENHRCIVEATSKCRESPIRAIKTVRIQVYMLPELLKLIPDLKVIFYVRDPRGNLLSRRFGSKFIETPEELEFLERDAKGVCSRMGQYLKDFKELKLDNVFLMKYEDLASEPIEFLVNEYKNLNLNLDKNVLRWFRSNTAASISDGLLGTKRVNSTSTAYNWQKVWTPNAISVIHSACRDILQELNYPDLATSA